MAAPALLIEYAERIEEELARVFRGLADAPAGLAEAMAYSACGGKRFRGALAMGACAAVGGEPERALPAACALEMVHAFSLVHDDLPCMDNSDFRRGKPTSHRVFGEAMALLAGDALLVEGLSVLVKGFAEEPALLSRALGILLWALGMRGMIGGQVLDMEASAKDLSLDELRGLHAAKTGALIRAAARLGAIAGGATPAEEEALDRYAASVGLAFQIVDDLLDLSGDEAKLGKPVGSDLRNAKTTYPLLLGEAAAREMAAREIERALGAILAFGERGRFLAELARYVVERDR